MNKYEEALKEVVGTLDNSNTEGRFLTRSNLDLLQELVKRVMPRYAWYDSPKYRCPRCEEDLTYFKGRQGVFCPQCGQKIVWK